MAEIIYLVTVGFFLQLIFIRAGRAGNHLKAIICKACASLTFIAIGILAYKADASRFNQLILIGLVLGGLGDVLMDLRFFNKKLEPVFFLSGTASFLVGHIFYTFALIEFVKNPLTGFIWGLLFAVPLLVSIFKVVKAEPALKAVGVVYITIIVMMMSTSIAAGKLVFALGALCFVCSDTALIIYNFSDEFHEEQVRVFCLVSYYIAQALIAISLVL